MADFQRFLMILLGLFIVSCTEVKANADMSFMDQSCNGGMFGALDLITPVAATSALEGVMSETPKAELLDYYTENTAASVYAHGLCTSTLSSNDCASCMKYALQQLREKCSNRHIGGQIKLRDCKLRYEIYHFHNDY